MATYTLPSRGGIHKTLSSTTADRVNVPVSRGPILVEVFNRAASAGIYVRGDGQTAVAQADGTFYLPANGSITINVNAGEYVSVVGNGDAYSVAIPK